MILSDVHCHLDHPAISSRIDDVIANAKNASVKAMITNGINPETNNISLNLSKKYENVYSALGIYPIDALQNEAKDVEGGYPVTKNSFDWNEHINWIKDKIKTNRNVLAIGEVGLDYNFPEPDKDLQKKIFQRFIELSEKTKKPLIIHSRKAESDVVEMLLSSKLKNPVMHCFSGKKKLAATIRDNGWNFSIPSNVVRSQQFQRIVDETPLSQIFTETDAPYLSPFKDQINEPAFIVENVKKIAEIKKMTAEEVSNQIYWNFQRLFL